MARQVIIHCDHCGKLVVQHLGHYIFNARHVGSSTDTGSEQGYCELCLQCGSDIWDLIKDRGDDVKSEPKAKGTRRVVSARGVEG